MAILYLHAPDEERTFVNAGGGGDEFENALGDTHLIVFNADNIDRRVQFDEARPCGYGERNVHAGAIATIAPGDTVPIGKFNPWRFNNTFHRVACTYPDGAAGLRVCAARQP